MKNILIVNSFEKQNKPWLSLFKDLSTEFNFFVWSTDNYFIEKAKNFTEAKLNKKIYLGPDLGKKISFFLFFFFLPGLYLWHLLDLIITRSVQNIAEVICIGENEKIIFTPIALLLGFKVVWFDAPEISYERKPWLFIFLLKLFSKKVKIITFTSFKKKKLVELGLGEENIKNVYLGTTPQKLSHQDNIFFSLAKAEKSLAFFKNFTIGTVANLNDSGQVESLLRIAKACLAVIPNLQLVVIGSGSQVRNFNWLARKMEIEDKVWFVGEQEYLRKWFDNFNIYLAISREPTLFDLETVLEAEASGLPVLAPIHKNWEDLVIQNKTGFLIESEPETLAQKIIELGQDKRLVRLLGENAKTMTSKYFSRDRQLGEIKSVLNF